MPGIIIIDSALTPTEEVAVTTRVLDDEMNEFCKAWNLPYWRVYHGVDRNSVPADHFKHVLIDDSNEHPEWSGWHSSGGFFGNPNATTLTKDEWWSITADHENKEIRANPHVNIWRPWPGEPNWEVAQEVADPVQADWKTITTKFYGKAYGIRVSNYALPAWFNETSPPPYDAFGLCKRPGEIRVGGYAPIRNIRTGVRDNAWGRSLPWWARERRQWLHLKMRRLAAGRSALLLSQTL